MPNQIDTFGGVALGGAQYAESYGGEQSDSPAPYVGDPTRCVGVSKDGSRCVNDAKSGKTLCFGHLQAERKKKG